MRHIHIAGDLPLQENANGGHAIAKIQGLGDDWSAFRSRVCLRARIPGFLGKKIRNSRGGKLLNHVGTGRVNGDGELERVMGYREPFLW